MRIMDKKIEHLTDEEIDNLTIEVLQQHLEATKKKIANNKESRLKKAFTHVDFLERERRERLVPKVKDAILPGEEDQRLQASWTEAAKKDYDEHHANQNKLQAIARYYVLLFLRRNLRSSMR